MLHITQQMSQASLLGLSLDFSKAQPSNHLQVARNSNIQILIPLTLKENSYGNNLRLLYRYWTSRSSLRFRLGADLFQNFHRGLQLRTSTRTKPNLKKEIDIRLPSLDYPLIPSLFIHMGE